MEELPERRRAHCADRAGVEVEALDMGMGGCACEIFVLVTCRQRRQFAKAASAATQPQQEISSSENLQRGRVNITDFF